MSTVDDAQFQQQQTQETTTNKSTQQRSVSVGSPFQSQGTSAVTDNDGSRQVRGDESLPWRRPKPTKIRSRSLQPGAERSIENLPWLRQRDRSFSRQEQPMLYGKDKHPIRPWIEEVICLKRTELRRKIIEKEALEKVLLKASQIERKEIIRAQIIEHIDLKSVQKYFERGNFANLEEAQVAMEEELIQQYEEDTKIQHVKHEEDLSILELTKEIDALVRKDYEHKSSTVERVTRKQLQHEEQVARSTFSAVEDTTILKLDRHDELEMQLIRDKQIGVPWARGLRKGQQQNTHQPISHLEDSSMLSLNKSVIEQVQHQEQEIPVGWARGPKSSEVVLQHTDDSTILSTKEMVETNTIQQEQHETAVAWRRGRKPHRDVPTNQTAEITHTEDSSLLRVKEKEQEKVIHEEKPVAWRRGERNDQAQPQTVQHTEDTTILDVSCRETEETTPAEVAVPWLRGQKKTKPELIRHTEDSSILDIEKTETIESAVPWQRGNEQDSLSEVPVAWERGKKQILKQDVSQATVETIHIEVQPIVQPDKVPWLLIQKPKPVPIEASEEKQWPTGKRRPKEVEESEDVVLKPIPGKVAPTQQLEPQVELVETPKAWVRGEQKQPEEKTVEEKQWPTGKRKPKPEKETVDIQLKPIPKPEIPELSEAPTTWVRGKKEKPQIKATEEKQWPTGKQKPKKVQEPEQVHLKPIPRDTAQKQDTLPEPKTMEIKKPKIIEIEEPKAAEIEKPKVVKNEDPKDVEIEQPKVIENKETKEEEPREVVDIMVQKIIKKKIPKDQRRLSTKSASVDVEEVLPEQVIDIVQVEQPEEHVVEQLVDADINLATENIQTKPQEPRTKKNSKQRKPKTSQQSLEEEVYTDLHTENVVHTQPEEIIVPNTVMDTAEVAEPVQQFVLKEVQEEIEVVEKQKIKVSRTKQPVEITEEITIVTESIEQLEPITIPETNETANIEEHVIVEPKADKKKKKKKSKPTKQVMFNDELELFEAEEIDEDSGEEIVIEEVSSTVMELQPTTLATNSQQIEEIVVDETETEVFRKDLEVTTSSHAIKKERRQIVIDDSHPLPELELISQKRVQQVVETVAEEEFSEEVVVKEIHEESISQTGLPETIAIPSKPAIKAPRFIKKLQPAICQPDAPTILQCKIDGAPYPEIKWYFNDIELFASEKFVFNVTEKVATLEIAKVTAMDVGIYTCQAKNEAGVATSRTNIVLGKCISALDCFIYLGFIFVW